jgi:hypothetical protein
MKWILADQFDYLAIVVARNGPKSRVVPNEIVFVTLSFAPWGLSR